MGEVRGGKAFDLLQALNTGRSWSLCTLHANSASQAIARFSDCVLQSGTELPHRAIMANIGNSAESVIHIARIRGHRLVTEILNIEGFDNTGGECRFTPAIMSLAGNAFSYENCERMKSG